MLTASKHLSHNKISMNGENRMPVTNKAVEFKEEQIQVQDFKKKPPIQYRKTKRPQYVTS
jgi:hypothetical protein